MTRTILAYLDAGSASAIVTMILGGVAGVGVALKLWWRKVLVFLHIRKPVEDEPQAPTAVGPSPAAGAQTPAQEPVEPAHR